LSSSAVEDGCYSLKTKHYRRKLPTAKLLVSDRDYRNKGYIFVKMTCVHFLVKMFSVHQKLSKTQEWCQAEAVCFGEEITGAKTTTL
jgi:hypothetical protein